MARNKKKEPPVDAEPVIDGLSVMTRPPVPRKPPVDEQPPGSVGALTVTREIALGNGTRKPGDVLAVVHCMPGVTLGEVVNALHNPQLIGWGEPPAG